jgi:antitoxin VapB
MITTRVFKSGNSQAVRIPKEFQFDVDEVEIISRGDELIIRPKKDNIADAFDLITGLSILCRMVVRILHHRRGILMYETAIFSGYRYCYLYKKPSSATGF